MGIKNFIKYSAFLGLVAALVSVLIIISSVSERHEQLIVKKIRGDEDIVQVIGEYKSFTVKRHENYSGTSEDLPSLEYLLNVTGDKGSAYVRVMIISPDTDMEKITVRLQNG